MDIFSLRKSVSEMSQQELQDTMNELRHARRTVAKVETKKKTKKAPEPMELDYGNMNTDLLEQLLAALGGEE